MAPHTSRPALSCRHSSRDTWRKDVGGNIAILRRTFQALERGDMAGVLADLDENIEVRMPPEFPGAGTTHGHEGYLKIWAELEEAARDIRERKVVRMEAHLEREKALQAAGLAKEDGSSS